MSRKGNLITYDHSQCSASRPDGRTCNPSVRLALEDGEILRVMVVESYPELYTYEIAGVVIPQPEESDPGAQNFGIWNITTDQPTKVPFRLSALHSNDFGAYEVRIRVKTTLPDDTFPGDATLTIRTVPSEWNLDFGGGFVASGLTSKAYGLSDDTDPKIVEEPDKKSEGLASIASFLHVWHTQEPWAAITFGLGLDQDRGREYYFGPSLRLGDKATLTGGVVLGNVRRLPAGATEGQVARDPNVLESLGEKSVYRLFLGMSYSFLGGGQNAISREFALLEGSQVSSQNKATNPPVVQLLKQSEDLSGEPGGTLEVSIELDKAGVPVAWDIILGAQSIDPADQQSDQNGEAKVTVTLGAQEGINVVRARFVGKEAIFRITVSSP